MNTLEEKRKARAEYMREWNKRNPDRRKANSRATYLRHREKILARNKLYNEKHPADPIKVREYYLANQETIKERSRQWQADNNDRRRETARKFKQANPGVIEQRNRDYYARNKARCDERNRAYAEKNYAKIREWQKLYLEQNPDKKKAWSVNSKANRRLREKTAFPVTPVQLAQKLSMYGNLCWICADGANEVDHVIALARGGLHILANLRPICGLCNRRKAAKDYKQFVMRKAA